MFRGSRPAPPATSLANGAPGAADLRSSRLSSHASRLSSHAIGPKAPELPRSQIARLEQNSTFSKPATVNFRRGPVRNGGGEYKVAGQAATSQARSGNAADKKISHRTCTRRGKGGSRGAGGGSGES